jgi:hypothetical protein
MHLRPRIATALLLAAALPHVADAAPVEVTVSTADDALVETPPDGGARTGLRSAENALLRGTRAALSNLVCEAGTLTGSGPGPWRVHASIVEWIGPEELRGAFGPGAPGVALHASLFDRSLGEKFPTALADFPTTAERLAAAKSSRVLPIEEAVRQIASWATAQIAEAMEKTVPRHSGDIP